MGVKDSSRQNQSVQKKWFHILSRTTLIFPTDVSEETSQLLEIRLDDYQKSIFCNETMGLCMVEPCIEGKKGAHQVFWNEIKISGKLIWRMHGGKRDMYESHNWVA